MFVEGRVLDACEMEEGVIGGWLPQVVEVGHEAQPARLLRLGLELDVEERRGAHDLDACRPPPPALSSTTLLNTVSTRSFRRWAIPRAGVLERRAAGRTHVCRLMPEPIEEAYRWLALYRRFWPERLDAFEAELRREVDAS